MSGTGVDAGSRNLSDCESAARDNEREVFVLRRLSHASSWAFITLFIHA